MELSEFLKDQLKGRGTQAKFARTSGISDGTVSKWAKGGMDRAPNFENCIRIATGTRRTPLEIFEMAERPEFSKLFLKLFPDYQQKPATEEDADVFICPHKEHRELHDMLEEIAISKDESLIYGISINLKSLSASATGRPYSSGAVKPDDPPTAARSGDKMRPKKS
jgi:transcriptional regulator with XRE-family HTH domain